MAEVYTPLLIAFHLRIVFPKAVELLIASSDSPLIYPSIDYHVVTVSLLNKVRFKFDLSLLEFQVGALSASSPCRLHSIYLTHFLLGL